MASSRLSRTDERQRRFLAQPLLELSQGLNGVLFARHLNQDPSDLGGLLELTMLVNRAVRAITGATL